MDGYRQYFVNENDYSNKFLAKLKKVDKYLLNRIRHKIILKNNGEYLMILEEKS